jgi:hypothetical protein
MMSSRPVGLVFSGWPYEGVPASEGKADVVREMPRLGVVGHLEGAPDVSLEEFLEFTVPSSRGSPISGSRFSRLG